MERVRIELAFDLEEEAKDLEQVLYFKFNNPQLNEIHHNLNRGVFEKH